MDFPIQIWYFPIHFCLQRVCSVIPIQICGGGLQPTLLPSSPPVHGEGTSLSQGVGFERRAGPPAPLTWLAHTLEFVCQSCAERPVPNIIPHNASRANIVLPECHFCGWCCLVDGDLERVCRCSCLPKHGGLLSHREGDHPSSANGGRDFFFV